MLSKPSSKCWQCSSELLAKMQGLKPQKMGKNGLKPVI